MVDYFVGFSIFFLFVDIVWCVIGVEKMWFLSHLDVFFCLWPFFFVRSFSRLIFIIFHIGIDVSTLIFDIFGLYFTF